MGADDSLIGCVLGGRYRVDARLGSGGFGAVYRATHLELLCPVAIKILLDDRASPGEPRAGDDLIARFRREARLQASLRHPAIVRMMDFGHAADGTVYMVQEYIDGQTLHTHLETRGTLAATEVTDLLDELLEGLAVAHRAGIVHRDLKPANIMLAGDASGPSVRILDFGLAKVRDSLEGSLTITGTGQILGTPAVMAPEQIEQGPISPATDIYAIGAMLHLMLTGRYPFSGPLRVVLAAHLVSEAPPLPADVPPRLAALVRRAMAKAPTDRFSSAAAMLAALRSVDRAPAIARETPRIPPEPPPVDSGPVAAPHRLPVDLALLEETVRTPSLSADWRGVIAEPSADVGAQDAPDDPPDVTARRGRILPVLLFGVLVAAVLVAVVRQPAVNEGDAPSAARRGVSVDPAGPAEPVQPPDVAATDVAATDAAATDAAATDAAATDAAATDAALRVEADRYSGLDGALPPSADGAIPDVGPAAAVRVDMGRAGKGRGAPVGPTSDAPASPPRPAPIRPDPPIERRIVDAGRPAGPVSGQAGRSRAVKLWAIERRFDVALDRCRCPQAAALLEEARRIDPSADLDPWRARHLRCELSSRCTPSPESDP